MTLTASGSWTAAYAVDLEKFVADAESAIGQVRRVTVDLAGVAALDTLGTWLLERILRRAAEQGGEAQFSGLPERYGGIVEEMRLVNRQKRVSRKAVNPVLAWLDRVGRAAVNARAELMIVVEMLGALALSLARVVVRPRSFSSDVRRPSSLPGRLAGDPDHRPDHVPDRGDHLATGHFPFSQVRRGILRGRHGRASSCCAKSAC